MRKLVMVGAWHRGCDAGCGNDITREILDRLIGLRQRGDTTRQRVAWRRFLANRTHWLAFSMCSHLRTHKIERPRTVEMAGGRDRPAGICFSPI